MFLSCFVLLSFEPPFLRFLNCLINHRMNWEKLGNGGQQEQEEEEERRTTHNPPQKQILRKPTRLLSLSFSLPFFPHLRLLFLGRPPQNRLDRLQRHSRTHSRLAPPRPLSQLVIKSPPLFTTNLLCFSKRLFFFHCLSLVLPVELEIRCSLTFIYA